MRNKPQSRTSSESSISRRKFLTRTTTAALGISIVPRHVLGGTGHVSPSDKINIAFADRESIRDWMNGQGVNPQPRGSFDDAASGLRTGAVTGGARQRARSGPAAVAVGDDGDVQRARGKLGGKG